MHLTSEQRRLTAIASRARASSMIAPPPAKRYRRPRLVDRSKSASAEAARAGGDSERRRFRRVAMASRVSVRRIGGFNFEVVLHDLSIAGCRVELIEAAEPHEPIIARFPQLEPMGGEVRWAESTTAGLQFSRPMHEAVLESLLARL